MSKTKAEIAEALATSEARVEELEALLSEAQAEIESIKEKNKRNVNDYKKKLKAAAKDQDALRQAGYNEAVEQAEGVRTAAATIRKRLLAEDMSTKGLVYVEVVKAKIELIDQIFGK